MEKLPKVSVVITVYNGENYIREALQSINDQNYANLEIIIIDDGSTDRTAHVVHNFPASINYEFQENSGIASGWNRGVEVATGKYLTFIDADDRWSEDKVKRQVDLLESKPEIDIIFGHVIEFYSSDVFEKHGEKQPIPGYSAGTMMIKKEKFLNIGMFNTKWIKGIFTAWYMRASDAGLTTLMDDEIYLYRRIHNKNHGIQKRDNYVDYVRILKESLDRKRKK